MQSGAESMMFMQGAVSSGADVIAGIGSCINANGLSSEMIANSGRVAQDSAVPKSKGLNGPKDWSALTTSIAGAGAGRKLYDG